MIDEATLKRFWAKVLKTDGCWLWQASKRNKGYGAFVWTDNLGKTIQGRAHRFSWELVNGPIPGDLCALHRCDTPVCVNPAHLFVGTKAENNADMTVKGRRRPGGSKTSVDACGYQRGAAHHGAKMTADKVRQVRAFHMAGQSYSTIARAFDISITTVFKICTGKTWRHVD